eukprot:3763111-Pyramimonas_sp.AAC.1
MSSRWVVVLPIEYMTVLLHDVDALVVHGLAVAVPVQDVQLVPVAAFASSSAPCCQGSPHSSCHASGGRTHWASSAPS